jgi:hypothetical protein
MPGLLLPKRAMRLSSREIPRPAANRCGTSSPTAGRIRNGSSATAACALWTLPGRARAAPSTIRSAFGPLFSTTKRSPSPANHCRNSFWLPRAGPFGAARITLRLNAVAEGCRIEMSEVPVSRPWKWLPHWAALAAAWPRNRECTWRLAALAERRKPGVIHN